MEQSPEVGIMQFSSGVMQVVHTYFENGITFFTNLIYTAIRYTVSNGDVAPFVGHNAILRWSAIQQVSYVDEDEYEKFWSESHVSEDFDMSLRLQVNGFTIRLAAWAGEGFKEGVSLTVYDELARWEKYAYGCNELLFNPLRKWLYKGPFTPLFRSFLFSNIRFTSKVTIISYIGTYYAIGAAWIMTTANYFAVGWWNGYLDKYYVDSWKVWFSIIIVFNGLGNIALAVMRYRIGERKLLFAFYENFKWTIMFAIFLGGLSLHVSQALLAHMFEINMTWGATSKEAEFSNFFIEVPKGMLIHPCITSASPQITISISTQRNKTNTKPNHSPQKIQILHPLRSHRHNRHDSTSSWKFRPTRLANHRFRGYSSHGHGLCFAFVVAACVESGFDDFFVLVCSLFSFFYCLGWICLYVLYSGDD